MNPYNYPKVKPRFNLRLEKSTRRWCRYAVDFPVAKPMRYQENNTALGEYYQPRQGENWPLAILVHGWGDSSVIPCKLLARDLVSKGISCFILYLVFHSSRMAEAVKKRLPNLTAEEWFEGYQTSVIEVRQIIDWANSIDGLNKRQIAVIGLSLGGMISAISMGVDTRLSAGIIMLAGGNYENPAWLRKTGVKRTEAEYIEAENLYRQYVKEVAQKGLDNVVPLKKSYLTDPFTFSTCLHDRPLMMINAIWDERIPKSSTVDFWEACHRPLLEWLPGTHSSVWLLYPLIRRRIIGFLQSTFTS